MTEFMTEFYKDDNDQVFRASPYNAEKWEWCPVSRLEEDGLEFVRWYGWRPDTLPPDAKKYERI